MAATFIQCFVRDDALQDVRKRQLGQGRGDTGFVPNIQF
jgi:hypothetical protein